MEIVENPPREQWNKLTRRAEIKGESLHDTVASILSKVKAEGDDALYQFARDFDHVELGSLVVTPEEFAKADTLVDESLKSAIRQAAANIEAFHAAQKMQPLCVTTADGVECWQKPVAIERVGLYIPGGNAPLFSTVLMLAVPARIAGCKEIILTTPPDKQGNIHPAILYAAMVAGVTTVIKTGGAQAIAALAYGTATVPRVNKIFGPGNRFVTEAKKQVSADGIAIDMPAGPSEVMIIADSSADMDFVAADFLSQAEHGPDSQSIMLTDSPEQAGRLSESIDKMLRRLPKQDMIMKSLQHSRVITFTNTDDLWDFANEYAPEHLIVNTVDPEVAFDKVINAGSVFLGKYSPESVGDYASGTNHTLPTGGCAKAFSGVNLDSFIKKITFQRLSQDGIRNLAPVVATMAENEHLQAHRLAVDIRVEKI
ncbi:MAG: histidinol dehydrogenase [Muribaculaceae bacterium]|nr:histidinol dehydrogenase [Muribaculaceae bacterium]